MNTSQAKEKIAKLLALAQSDNANEASAALLAARRLMARHKLSERDIEKDHPKALRTVLYEEATFSGIRNGWFIELARVVAKHHCCGFFQEGKRGSTVRSIGFVGLDDDPDIACTLFNYAVDHVKRWGSQKRESLIAECKYKRIANELVKNFIYNYAAGFAQGLKKKYEEQDIVESDETALVLVEPVEVINYMSGLKRANINMRNTGYIAEARAQGYTDGYKFNPTKQIK